MYTYGYMMEPRSKEGDTFSPKNTKLFDHHYTNRFFLFIFIFFVCRCCLPAFVILLQPPFFSHCNASISRYISICVLLFFFVVLGSSLFSIFLVVRLRRTSFLVFARVLVLCARFIHSFTMCKCL